MSEKNIQLLTATHIRQLCKALDIKPTKTLGQNFVTDPSTVRNIVAKAGNITGKHVLEVGPGLGSLTLGLLEQGAYLSAVEIDPKLAQLLPQTVKARAKDLAGNLRILNQDALKLSSSKDFQASNYLCDLPEVKQKFEQEPQYLIANLPYNVAVPIVLNLLENFPSITTVLVMVQLEVAQRLTATSGNKIYGVPSLKLAWYGTSKIAGKIGTNVFIPAPNVESALVLFERHDSQLATVNYPPSLREVTFQLIDTAFGQRRKTVRQSLKKFCEGVCSVDELLEKSQINPQLRAEMLSVDDFVNIAKTYQQLQGGAD